MAAPRRTPFQVENDRRQITSWYLRGLTQADIGERLGMTQQMVAYDLKAIQDRWKEQTVRDLDADKARELAKIDELERTYWSAWESSVSEKAVTSTEKTMDAGIKGEGTRSKASVRRELRDGNPAFLEGVMKCIERRCKLLGIDAPTKLSDPDGKPLIPPTFVLQLGDGFDDSDPA